MDVRGAHTFPLRNRLPNPNLEYETDTLSLFSTSRTLIFFEGFIDYFPRLSNRGTQIKFDGDSFDFSISLASPIL